MSVTSNVSVLTEMMFVEQGVMRMVIVRLALTHCPHFLQTCIRQLWTFDLVNLMQICLPARDP